MQKKSKILKVDQEKSNEDYLKKWKVTENNPAVLFDWHFEVLEQFVDGEIRMLYFNHKLFSLRLLQETWLFDIFYPKGISNKIIESVKTISSLLNLYAFTNTFDLEADHSKVLEVVKKEKLRIRFMASKEYNKFLIGLPKDYHVDEEYGWFDARHNSKCIYINYDVIMFF